uniref:Glutamate-rich 3 n=1 Tax=Erpetoichthys calabaricus TaxID=27687 RepID=A0A8C4S8V8_ERPCA
MSHHPHSGLIAAYNSLTDRHLIGYFNNTRVRRHLRRAGLVTKNGRIVPEKEYKNNLLQKDHERYLRESIAQAVFQKVLDLERHHKLEIRKKLEEITLKRRTSKIKAKRVRKHDVSLPMLSPHPPTYPRSQHAQVPEEDGEPSEGSDSLLTPRPYTAPGKMQRPVRLEPISKDTAPSQKRTVSGVRKKYQSEEDQHMSREFGKEDQKYSTKDFACEVSPYLLPVINNYVVPVPPPSRKEKNSKGKPKGTVGGRRLRPTTAPNLLGVTKESTKYHKNGIHSNVVLTMVYFGRTVHLTFEALGLIKEEVKILQQHCGGENLCIYHGQLSVGETFQFISKRHHGFPFSLSFYVDGLLVDRLSSCCEFKHRRGSRLGGKSGPFGFLNIEGATPCYKCIISMGLDKKPTPPKRMKEESDEKTQKDDEYEEDFEGDAEVKVKKESDNESNESGSDKGKTMSDEEKASYSGSESEYDDKSGDRGSRSSMSSMYSLSSSKDGTESQTEDVKDSVQEETLKASYSSSGGDLESAGDVKDHECDEEGITENPEHHEAETPQPEQAENLQSSDQGLSENKAHETISDIDEELTEGGTVTDTQESVRLTPEEAGPKNTEEAGLENAYSESFTLESALENDIAESQPQQETEPPECSGE